MVSEFQPKQSKFTETTVVERITRGVIEQGEFVRVPIDQIIRIVKLPQDTEVRQMEGKMKGKIPVWEAAASFDVEERKDGVWIRRNMPEGTKIGARWKQVKKQKVEKITLTVKTPHLP